MANQDFTLPSWMRWQALPAPLEDGSLAASTARRMTPMQEAPCRRCLHDTVLGEEVILISYDPFLGDKDSPYHSRSPIFVHARDCTDVRDLDLREMPVQQQSRLLSIRGFNKEHMMTRAELAQGVEALRTHGCFAVKVGRQAAIQ
ncbi:hypothetical protein LTR53_006699 [Teratosphaeriaceae sp. CCFEE 6253]|nr:hypothetical protein LTR53_006699 [Teratosphaeriaceae sp. CCFEE 6253]